MVIIWIMDIVGFDMCECRKGINKWDDDER